MEQKVNLYQILETATLLSTMEKLKLIQQLTTQIESELRVTQPKPRKSLRGLWRGLNISEAEIAEARNEMWGNFPKESI
jgi:hypothetical protein